MPAFDFQCSQCGQVEEWFLAKHRPQVNCTHCGGVAEYLPSFNYTSRAQSFSPVVIHRDAHGNIRLPGNSDSPIPPGFTRVELNTLPEIRRFEREMNRKETEKLQENQSNKRAFLDAQLAYSRECVAPAVANFSPKGKAFYERMREVSEQKQKEFASRSTREANFHLEAFSMDSSNRDPHRDSSNDWGFRNRK